MRQKAKQLLVTLISYFLAGCVVADVLILNAFERYIADPLQLRGISLLTQYRFANGWWAGQALVVAAQGFMHPAHSYIAALVIVGMPLMVGLSALDATLFPTEERRRRLEPPAAEEVPTVNIARSHPVCILIRMIAAVDQCALFPLVFQGELFLGTMLMPMLLLVYLDACQPKPPRPKKEKSGQKVGMDGSPAKRRQLTRARPARHGFIVLRKP